MTRPPELQSKDHDSKLITPRAWVGYFVGCESESTYRIWDPSKRKVVRLAAARTDDGQGLGDVHEEPDIDQLETRELIIHHAVWNNPKQKTRTKLNLNLEKELQGSKTSAHVVDHADNSDSHADNDLFVRPTYGLYTFEGSVLPVQKRWIQ